MEKMEQDQKYDYNENDYVSIEFKPNETIVLGSSF